VADAVTRSSHAEPFLSENSRVDNGVFFKSNSASVESSLFGG